jgi:hypothetical protein
METKFVGGFVTPWEYNTTVEYEGKTYTVWECRHREGYNAYQLVNVTGVNGSRLQTPPRGTGHFTNRQVLNRLYGWDIAPNHPITKGCWRDT